MSVYLDVFQQDWYGRHSHERRQERSISDKDKEVPVCQEVLDQ